MLEKVSRLQFQQPILTRNNGLPCFKQTFNNGKPSLEQKINEGIIISF